MQKILFTWEYEMSRLDSNKSSSFPRPLVGSSSTSRPLPRPLNAAPLPPTGKAWMLYICTQSNLIRHSDMVTRSTTGCSGKIVFFHNPLQPILRLHIAARDFRSNESVQSLLLAGHIFSEHPDNGTNK